jgi:D-alanyl-D-alanine carboxypeptidase
MKKTICLSLLSIIFLILFFGSCKKNNDNPETEANKPITDQLDRWGDSLIKENIVDSVNLPVQGAMIYVNDPAIGLSYSKAFGTSDISTSKYSPLRTGDLFRIGTITNTFTTTVFLQLIQDSVLNLEDKLDKFFPAIPNSSLITLRQIANMTSGLFDFNDTDSILRIRREHPLTVLTPQQLIDFAMAVPPYFQPGEGFHYSSTNSVLLGMIIQQVTGDALSETYRNRILEPLSISNTTFPTNQFMPFYTSYSHGYEYSDSLHILVDETEKFDPSSFWGSANLISDLADLQVWLPALVNGSLLNAITQQERMKMVDWGSFHGIPLQYGLGIMGTSGYFGHSGDIPGYHCVIMYSPASGRTIVVMVNNGSYSPLIMFARIANLLSPGLIPLTP